MQARGKGALVLLVSLVAAEAGCHAPWVAAVGLHGQGAQVLEDSSNTAAVAEAAAWG